MTVKRRIFWLGAPIWLAAGLIITGCNGADEVRGDDPTDDVVGDAPAPKSVTCAYPTGVEFGVSADMTVPVDRVWQGLAPDSSVGEQIAIANYYDCDGSRGIDALMIDTSQYG